MRILALLLVLVCAACATETSSIDNLARAQVTADFRSYKLRRVGFLPFRGETISAEQSRALQSACVSELSHAAPFEIVPLDRADMEEVPTSEPFHRGWIRPATILALARRYNLDALFVGTVTQMQSFAPQKISLELDLVAVETGLAIWSADLQLDASHERVRRTLQAWYEQHRASKDSGEGFELYLISPRRFAEFAAAQIAQVL